MPSLTPNALTHTPHALTHTHHALTHTPHPLTLTPHALTHELQWDRGCIHRMQLAAQAVLLSRASGHWTLRVCLDTRRGLAGLLRERMREITPRTSFSRRDGVGVTPWSLSHIKIVKAPTRHYVRVWHVTPWTSHTPQHLTYFTPHTHLTLPTSHYTPTSLNTTHTHHTPHLQTVLHFTHPKHHNLTLHAYITPHDNESLLHG